MTTRVLTRADVESLLVMVEAVPAVEAAFAAHGRGETLMPAKVYLPLEQVQGDFRAMPAYLDGSAGVKWVNAHPMNPERHGLPSVLGMYILSDPATALPLAVMDATYLTAVRTGAAAAVASKHLASPDIVAVGFIGSGVQARSFHSALSVVYGGFEVLAADRDPEAARRFASEVGGRATSLEEASGCDIVCTATPSRSPVVQRSWLKAGTHLNAMGADGPGKQELDPQILLDGRIFLDDWHQATESGEVNVPLSTGVLDRSSIAGTLGEVIAGIVAGRRNDQEITIFDSTGLAVQDVALARLVYERACEQKVGLEVDFTGLG